MSLRATPREPIGQDRPACARSRGPASTLGGAFCTAARAYAAEREELISDLGPEQIEAQRLIRRRLETKRTVAFLILLWAASSAALPGASEVAIGETMPQILYTSDPDREYPIWVAAQAAFRSPGELDSDLIPPVGLDSFRRFMGSLDLMQGDCIVIERHPPQRINPPDRSSIEKLVSSSDFIVRGRVAGTAIGLSAGGTPATLVKIIPEEFLIGGYEGRTDYYVLFPIGRLELPGPDLCATKIGYPQRPSLGDELVLFVPYRLTPGASMLDTYGSEGILRISKDGEVELPYRLTEESLTGEEVSRERILREVRKATQRAQR